MQFADVQELVKEDLAAVEEGFRTYLDSDVPLIRKIGEYVLGSGGKRVRPMLLLLSARMSGYEGQAHTGLASVVEFIHTATLLHDDVVDKAQIRRGQASANALFGNAASVLVGDFLFAKSFAVMVRGGSMDILRVMADATTTMAQGEVLQLMSTCDVGMKESQYMQVVREKTAVLMAAACQCGGLLGGMDQQRLAALEEFGMQLGLAFQFMDDALDYVADEQEFGKTIGQDLAEGKMTLPLIETLRHATPDEADRIEGIVQQEEEALAPEDLNWVLERMAACDAVSYTRQRADELISSAKEQLQAFPQNTYRAALETLADYVVNRTK